ncbi:DUF2461 domain-containing protein [Sulfurimonas sp. HSL3-7]|uniref:DUF2461 domain-containing protein n=1 Tax=Sulfonitrofixus jiaomeiensis TaxID=3131938 RepID=UPI0031F7CC50
MPFEHFPKEAIPFLRSIEQNNTKEWFEAHKDGYTKYILEPSRAFVEEMGEHLQALVPTINAIPKINHSLFRIYRDTRFSKDKTPIKSKIGIIFWQGQDIRMQSSCFYLHFSPRELLIASGIRTFDPDLLAAYRDYIKVDKNREALHLILEALKNRGYTVEEPHYKRLPRGFDKKMSLEYLARMKAIAVYHTDKASLISEKKLIPELYRHYETFLPLQQWLYVMSLTKSRD